jgi:glucan phosphoethanolaminetransferase (alkaline phosphatase superfamily)
LQLNGYPRPTTPNLSTLGADLLSFSDVASTANWTNAAVPNIVSRRIGKDQATLVQTFREAGFQTAWISNQEPSLYARNAHVAEQGRDAQDFHLRTDANLLPMFSSFVHQAGPRQFVLLHMIGSHIPYEERYGADSRVFAPTLSDLGINAPQPVDRDATVNSYDNTVVETDKFLSRVIATLSREQRPAVLLFTSDHGENLFDDQRGLFMHTQHPATRYDTHVPMLVWMNPAYRQAHPQIAATLQANRARKITHTQVFPSLLELGGVDWDGRDARESFASPSFVEAPRKVLVDLEATADYESLK